MLFSSNIRKHILFDALTSITYYFTYYLLYSAKVNNAFLEENLIIRYRKCNATTEYIDQLIYLKEHYGD